MLIKTFLTVLYDFINRPENVKYIDYLDFIFIPVVNYDGHFIITESNTRLEYNLVKDIRKNRNEYFCNEKFINMGVDLNRNYNIHFGDKYDPEVFEPCSEVFEGPFPFSEPEVQLVKNVVETEKNIV